ncbi:MAG: hypothetical protein M9887_07775 [Chitinophagales bacterium]|nr:hypothetical protein [Chitinophagales bacterium]
MKFRLLVLLLPVVISFTSCKHDYVPKPNAYFQPDLPQHSYKEYDNPICPCTFDIPTYSVVEQEKHFFDEKPEHPCWLDVRLPGFNATIFLSYKNIKNRNDFERVIADTYKLTFKHSQKADFIDEELIENPKHNTFGYQFDVGGDAASSTQFFLTDSLHHYIRGALYFHSTPNIDSVSPSLDYLKKDIDHLISSLQWR